MKMEAGYAKWLVAVTTVLPVFATDGSPAITAFLDRIPAARINSCIVIGRNLNDFTIHLQFQSSLLGMMATELNRDSTEIQLKHI